LRLTHLKLAGFKSFVDPTTLHIHGQRVGVVGPNGCGKSNVMESVRWVLGESSAKEMRGDSMDAVIFNGSGNRKAISRASAELVFDNSLGGASDNSAGEWSQYAEIAVKRVIERDKGSTYYINNTPVRRRDVADLFLGTGLGGRAYAIIGQNTISRIVEAKPEELRIFLEEAAGISKYKERRRETELRLRDTRENLLRIDDIRRELEKQIIKLESQAMVAEQFHRLQADLKHAQGQLWLIRKRDAGAGWEKSKRQVEKFANDLEAQIAGLRKLEAMLEALRQQHYASTEAVQSAQTRYYEANAEVSNLEQQARHTQESRERLTAQLQQFTVQSQKAQAQLVSLQDNLKQLATQQQASVTDETQAQQALQAIRMSMPQLEQAHSAALQSFAAAQTALTEAEQGVRLETVGLGHLDTTITESAQRQEHLKNQLQALQLTDKSELLNMQDAYQKGQAEMSSLEQAISELSVQEQQYADQARQLRETQLMQQRSLAQVEAQIASLNKIQDSLGHEAKLDQWLKTAGLDRSKRLWQGIKMESGWETALEAVLGARLNAVSAGGSMVESILNVRPPAAMVFFQEAEGSTDSAGSSKQPLLAFVKEMAPGLSGLLQDWLAGSYVLDRSQSLDQQRNELQAGEMLVSRLGDIYTRYSVSVYAAQSALHGVLERQRELTDLQESLPGLQKALKMLTDTMQQAEISLQQAQQKQQQKQQLLRDATASQHNINLEIQRLRQQQQHAIERRQSLLDEQQKLEHRLAMRAQERRERQDALETINASLSPLQAACLQAQAVKQAAEAALGDARTGLQVAEKSAQEKTFGVKLLLNNINEINNKINAADEELNALAQRRTEAEGLLAAARMEGLKANLEAALSTKQQNEAALAEARNGMTVAEEALQVQERARMQAEQLQHPLRDKLEQARLAEQEARLNFEQCHAELATVGLEESELAKDLPASAKAAAMEQNVSEIGTSIDALGPVNLAAIQELVSERERNSYLTSQASDLEQAITTLEEAIHRIDRETRSRLQQTFDEANRHFAELFAVLFDGGQAKLELLGENILDTGMQVFAQPPGKKNTTIHLLSGGEKALTALALIFALFRLNPAPFCLMDEVDAPLDDSNTERFCNMVKKMSEHTQFLFVSHNKITMEMAQQLIGVTMQESGVSRIVEVDIEAAMQMHNEEMA
jgi:chromosome segregation protein